MNSRNYLNIALVVVVAGLLLLALFGPDKGDDEGQNKRLSSLEAQNVNTIHIEHADGNVIELKKTADGWKMLKPYSHAANQIKVQSLLTMVNAKSYAQYAKSTLDLKKFGLDEPKIKVKFDSFVIAVGETESLSLKRYVLAENNVHLIDDSQYRLLVGEPEQFLDLSVVPKNGEITRLVLPNLELSKKEDGSWGINPDKDEYSQDGANELIDEWRYLSATKVGPLQPQKKSEKVIIGLKQGNTLELSMTFEPEFILARPDLGIQYYISSQSKDSLLTLSSKSPEEQSP